MQPADIALSPQPNGGSTSLSTLSSSLATLVSLLLSSTSRPERLRLIASKPARSLDVWEKSALAASGKLRLDEADPALLTLAPLSMSLAELVSRILAAATSELESADQGVSLKLPRPRCFFGADSPFSGSRPLCGVAPIASPRAGAHLPRRGLRLFEHPTRRRLDRQGDRRPPGRVEAPRVRRGAPTRAFAELARPDERESYDLDLEGLPRFPLAESSSGRCLPAAAREGCDQRR